MTDGTGSHSFAGLDKLRRRPGMRRRFVVAIGLLVALVLLAQAAALFFIGSRYLENQIQARARATAAWPPSRSATPTSPISPAATANSRSWSARSPSSTPISTSWWSTTST